MNQLTSTLAGAAVALALLAGAGCKSFDKVTGRDKVDETTITTSQVPASVMSSFNARYPNATVRKIARWNDDGRTKYKFAYTDSAGSRREAQFDASGTFIK